MSTTVSPVPTPRHAGRTEAWINARAAVRRGWAPRPRHAHPARATLRTAAPVEHRTTALLRSVKRALTGALAHGAHGIAYARTAVAEHRPSFTVMVGA